VFRGNSSEFGGALSGGGSTEVFNSLFRANTAGLGGAIYSGNASNYYLTNATMDGNIASDVGGAIRVRDGHVSLSSSTLTNNRAGTDGGALAGKDDNAGTSLALSNSIVAGNIDEDGPGSAGPFPDCYDFSGGIFTSNGYNLFGDADGCAFTPGPGDQLGTLNAPVDPLLGPPAFNGGASPDLLTNALLPGSPAIDSGGNCSLADARGVPHSLGGSCDKGAYEIVFCHTVVVNRVGTTGDDLSTSPPLAPTPGADGFLGLEGNDVLKGAGGGDALCGGQGNDKLIGGAGKDEVRGGPGDDNLLGGKGPDLLIGGSGKDRCNGGPGKDKARGCEVKRGIP
jgi:predicted outer membrane repeat protein